MTVEENLKMLDAADKAFDARDWNGFSKAHAESVLLTDPGLPESIKGRTALREFAQAFAKAFPDLRTERVRAFGQGDWICAEYRLSGTNTGPMAGPGGQMIPATKKSMRISQALVAKVERGQFTEVHLYYDLYGMMVQLGLAK